MDLECPLLRGSSVRRLRRRAATQRDYYNGSTCYIITSFYKMLKRKKISQHSKEIFIVNLFITVEITFELNWKNKFQIYSYDSIWNSQPIGKLLKADKLNKIATNLFFRWCELWVRLQLLRPAIGCNGTRNRWPQIDLLWPRLLSAAIQPVCVCCHDQWWSCQVSPPKLPPRGKCQTVLQKRDTIKWRLLTNGIILPYGLLGCKQLKNFVSLEFFIFAADIEF